MEKLIIAILLGFSLNYFICIFLSLGMSSVNTKLALKFIAGRLLGLVTLSVLISAFGYVLFIPPKFLNLTFAVLCILFGGWLLFKKDCLPHPNIGFGLGFFRGMTPCVKIALIIPLIYGSNLYEAVLLVLAFGLASSIYPFIGLLFGGAITKFFTLFFTSADDKTTYTSQCATCDLGKKKVQNPAYNKINRYIKIFGAFLLILMGIYHLFIL